MNLIEAFPRQWHNVKMAMGVTFINVLEHRFQPFAVLVLGPFDGVGFDLLPLIRGSAFLSRKYARQKAHSVLPGCSAKGVFRTSCPGI